ncbi:DUF6953 family protein [Photobacterium leiognathi]|uniref:DUF6953 family protein n=1 Tax=Photobacterium leiognathi TaxID=553611 RepID=UPI0027381768|nr:hypothetical protein [Photobacterium leiognathi]
MDIQSVALWMQSMLDTDGCLYQDDVVDFLVKKQKEELLRENADGNLVIGRPVLNAFKKLNESSVVWVKADKYWRFRVPEDEDGRDARG